MPADEPGQYRDGRKDPLARDEDESGSLGELDVLGHRAIARMLEFRGGADEPALKEKVHARLQVREVGNRHEQLAPRPEDALQFGERNRLFLERQMLEHVEAQRAIEDARAIRQRRHRSGVHALRRVVRVDALDRETVRVLADQNALATSRVEHAHRPGERVEPGADGRELGEVGRIVVPRRVRLAMVIAARGVLATAHHRRAGAHDGVILQAISQMRSGSVCPWLSGSRSKKSPRDARAFRESCSIPARSQGGSSSLSRRCVHTRDGAVRARWRPGGAARSARRTGCPPGPGTPGGRMIGCCGLVWYGLPGTLGAGGGSMPGRVNVGICWPGCIPGCIALVDPGTAAAEAPRPAA